MLGVAETVAGGPGGVGRLRGPPSATKPRPVLPSPTSHDAEPCAGLGFLFGCCVTTDVQPRPLEIRDGAGEDVCERPGPAPGRGAWTKGARRSANFPNDVVEDDAANEVAEAERRGDGIRESIRRMSWTLR